MTDAQGLTCQKVVELVTEYLEGTLPAPDRKRFDEHLPVCRGCTDYLEQMRETIKAARRLDEEELDPNTRDQLMELFRDWKRTR